MTTLSIGPILSFAWNQYKQQPLVWVKIIIATVGISWVSTFIAQEALDNGMPLIFSFPLNVADFLLQMIIGLAMVYFAIRLHDGKSAHLSDALAPIDLLWRYIIGSILFGLGVIVGLILLIVPGIIFAIAGSMWPYLLVDKRHAGWLGGVQAIKESIRITRGNRWNLFLLGLVLFVLNIVGVIPFGLGLLITVPVSTLAIVHAYRQLDRAAAEKPHTETAEIPAMSAATS